MPVSIPPKAPEQDTVPPPRTELTKEQADKLSKLLDHLNADSFALPSNVKDLKAAWKKRGKQVIDNLGKPLLSSSKSAEEDQVSPLSDTEKCFLSREQCLRFLRAVKWDLPSAISRTEETVVWRREFQVEKINDHPEMVEEEAKTGKEVIMGWDINRRPCLYMFPYRQNTDTLDRQIQFVVWCLERTVDLMGPEVENLCLLIDLGTGEKTGGGAPTSLGQARKVLQILQTYYCERLGRALCIRIPMLFYTFYKLVGPFVDPVTKDKIRFNPDCRTLVPPSQLDKQVFGGDYDFEYKQEEYFMHLHEVTKKRREANMERWRQYAGNKCGLSEFIIKGGNEQGEEVQETSTVAATVNDAGAATANGTAQSTNAQSVEGVATPSLTSGSARDQSAATSGSSSPAQPDTPAKAFEDAQTSRERNADALLVEEEEGGIGRPRGNSTDSFVSTKEHLSPVTSNGALPNTSGTGASTTDSDVDKLETGIAGLVVKEDGSIGAA